MVKSTDAARQRAREARARTKARADDERKRDEQRAKVARERQALLLPFEATIERYVQQFSDHPLRYPGAIGGGYGTQRMWMKRFIEDYAIANGRLPTGVHRIEAKINSMGYSGGSHDFSDLENLLLPCPVPSLPPGE